MEGPIGIIASIILLILFFTQGGKLSDKEQDDYRPPTDRWS